MRRRLTASLCLAAAGLGSALSAHGDEGPLSLSGSVSAASGYASYRDGIPDAAARDWYALTYATARLSRRGESAGFYTELWTQFDAATGTWALSLDEAWVELRAGAFLDLRLGRSPLLFGPCVAFSPANPMVRRDGFDPRANKVGLDGVSLELRPLAIGGERDGPVTLLVDAALLLPSGSTATAAAYDLDETSAHARVTLYAPAFGILGSTELGVSGDARRLGGTAPGGEIPMAAGAWISADIAGFVLGAEGGVRSHDYDALSQPGAAASPVREADGAPPYRVALSVNRRLGDFLALVEAEYEGADGPWKGFCQASWASGDFAVAASGLADFSTRSARAGVDIAWNASDSIVMHARGGWNYLPEEWEPPLPTEYSAGLALECFY